MNYEFILKYYKSFCTKVSNISNFFSDDSSLFFIGDFGKTSIAYGRQQILEQLNDTFWTQTGNNIQPIGYNINIEQKKRSVCAKPGETYNDSEVAIVIIGNIKAIYSSDDIRLTKLKGRKFVQTFLLYRSNDNNYYCKSTVLAYMAPSDAFNDIINSETSPKATDYCSDDQVFDDSTEKNLEFAKIAQNIDELINETVSYDLDSKTGLEINDLLPISLNELFTDEMNAENVNKVEEKDPLNYETFSYLSDIWSQTWNKDLKNETIEKDVNKKWIDDLSSYVSKESRSNENSGTSFADALRNGLQHSWQNYKLDDKCHQIRIIQSCGKSRFKSNCWQNSGKSDRKSQFVGQQNITIIGAQNLEEMPETNTLFVANIPIGVSKTHFMALFDFYGKVLSMKFVDRTGVAFAFIYFDSKTSVDNVMKTTTGNNNFNISGLQLKVDRYKSRMPTNGLTNQMHSK